jgi:hypothetical protein
MNKTKTWFGIPKSLLFIALVFTFSKTSLVIPCYRIDCYNVCNSFDPRISLRSRICPSRTIIVEDCWNNVMHATIHISLFCAGAISSRRNATYAWRNELASPYQKSPPPISVRCNGTNIQRISSTPPNR